jgi:hypothetical protein
MNQTDAIKILIKAAKIGQRNGSYSLSEAAAIYDAISCFIDISSEENDIKEETENSVNNQYETVIDNN